MNKEDRATIRARDDQQIAAYEDCLEEMRDLAEAVERAGQALNDHGLPFDMVVSQLTGVVASAAYQAGLKDFQEQLARDNGVDPAVHGENGPDSRDAS